MAKLKGVHEHFSALAELDRAGAWRLKELDLRIGKRSACQEISLESPFVKDKIKRTLLLEDSMDLFRPFPKIF
ncbi:MAG: hypothetical protein JSS60_00080 [Verrucomicrobia bacterium]|nr:hypothetical protein [Verrucomicrobiota bacterium]